jgi:uncharacterized protein YjhX (UPF0386 family)
VTAAQREVLQALADGTVLTVQWRGEVARVWLCAHTGEAKAAVFVTAFEALKRRGWIAAREETIRHPAVGAERTDCIEQTYEITASGLDVLHEERLR